MLATKNQKVPDVNDALRAAAKKGCLAAVRFQGVEVDNADKNNNNSTALYIAAEEGQIEVLQFLVEQGADKDKADNNGVTALMISASKGHLDCLRYLVEQFSEKDKASNTGATALMAAAAMGHVDALRYLME